MKSAAVPTVFIIDDANNNNNNNNTYDCIIIVDKFRGIDGLLSAFGKDVVSYDIDGRHVLMVFRNLTFQQLNVLRATDGLTFLDNTKIIRR